MPPSVPRSSRREPWSQPNRVQVPAGGGSSSRRSARWATCTPTSPSPWAPPLLQPLGLFSAYDPPVLPQAPFLAKLRFLGPALHRPLFRCARRSVRSWSGPWHRLRAEVGLPPTSDSPLFEGQHSPSLV